LELQVRALPEGQKIPKIVETCISVVESRGLDVQGLYRLSGNASNIQKMKAALNQSKWIEFIHIICKTYIYLFKKNNNLKIAIKTLFMFRWSNGSYGRNRYKCYHWFTQT